MTWKIIDTDKSAEESAHDKLYTDLEISVANAFETLEVPHVLHCGLDYFIGIAYKCANNEEDAETLINETIKRAKNEYRKPD